MSDLMQYAFIDESGTVNISGGSHFLVVALLSTAQPRPIELTIRRAMKKYGTSLRRGEIKAANFEEKAITRLLETLGKEDISIFATIVDQTVIVKPPEEIEDIYRQAVAKTVYALVKYYPRVNICLDRRYTNERHRLELEAKIRQTIQTLPQQKVLIRQENSIKQKELQAVDAISWAIFQKYERYTPGFYELIASKIVSEELIQEKDWTK